MNEQWLAWLAEESGGRMILPNSIDEFTKASDNLAPEIDSQYVLTYTPRVRFRLDSAPLVRRVQVISRRVGLHVNSRRSHVVPASPAKP